MSRLANGVKVATSPTAFSTGRNSVPSKLRPPVRCPRRIALVVSPTIRTADGREVGVVTFFRGCVDEDVPENVTLIAGATLELALGMASGWYRHCAPNPKN